MSLRALCSYIGCKNSKSKKPNLRYFWFPRDIRRQLWIQHSGNVQLKDLTDEQLDRKFICIEHFYDSDIIVQENGVKKLKYYAVPKNRALDDQPEDLPYNDKNSDLSIEQNNPIDSSPDVSLKTFSITFLNCDHDYTGITLEETNNDEESVENLKYQIHKQTEEILKVQKSLKDVEEASASKLKLARRIYEKRIQHKDERLRQFKKQINNLTRKLNRHDITSKEAINWKKKFDKLDVELKDFFNMQTNHIKKTQWTNSEIQFAISLFQLSPKAYCHLRKNYNFKLPGISNLREYIHNNNKSNSVPEGNPTEYPVDFVQEFIC